MYLFSRQVPPHAANQLLDLRQLGHTGILPLTPRGKTRGDQRAHRAWAETGVSCVTAKKAARRGSRQQEGVGTRGGTRGRCRYSRALATVRPNTRMPAMPARRRTAFRRQVVRGASFGVTMLPVPVSARRRNANPNPADKRASRPRSTLTSMETDATAPLVASVGEQVSSPGFGSPKTGHPVRHRLSTPPVYPGAWGLVCP